MEKNTESVENKLQELIDRNNLGKILTIDTVKDLVWHEEGDKAFNEFTERVLGYFNNIRDVDELNGILQVFNDAWNYFPHKCLNGQSPAQVVGEDKK